MLMKITNWRKSEFQYLKERMYRKQLEEKIDLYNMYSDVLSHKEKKELEKLKNEKSQFIVIGIMVKLQSVVLKSVTIIFEL